MAPVFTLVNIAATLTAGIAFLYLGWRIGRQRLHKDTALIAFSQELLWTLIGAGLLTVGLRESAALLQLSAVNKALFHTAGFFFAGISAPLCFQAAYLFTREKTVSLAAAGIMAVFAALSPLTVLLQDVKQISTGYGTEFIASSQLPHTLFIAFTVIPTAVFCIYLIGIGSRMENTAVKQSTLLMPLGLLFLVLLVFLDFLPLTGVHQLTVRLLYLGTAAYLYIVYFTGKSVEHYTV